MYAEWNNKAVGVVSYGIDGGVRAVDALRPVFSALQLAHVPAPVALNLRTDFSDFGAFFSPGEHQDQALTVLLDRLLSLTTALTHVRGTVPAVAS
ncbi:NADPH-dependent FMN reductase [Kribbella sp. DT2]|uniref:NADPH-dependent FMN reductase n=1 Tax=Kribbella sp. DT2 TaxID=3393427 RepID=UPI003CEA9517